MNSSPRLLPNRMDHRPTMNATTQMTAVGYQHKWPPVDKRKPGTPAERDTGLFCGVITQVKLR